MAEKLSDRVLARVSAGRLSKTKIEIPDARYKADLELHDRYLGFSSELLRMALAGMGAIGAIIGLLVKDGKIPDEIKSHAFVLPASRALVALALAAGLALLHRFLASDGMFYHFRAIKLLILSETRDRLSPKYEETRAKAEKDEKRRNMRFWLAGWLMFASGVSLIVGIGEAGFAIRGLLPA